MIESGQQTSRSAPAKHAHQRIHQATQRGLRRPLSFLLRLLCWLGRSSRLCRRRLCWLGGSGRLCSHRLCRLGGDGRLCSRRLCWLSCGSRLCSRLCRLGGCSGLSRCLLSGVGGGCLLCGLSWSGCSCRCLGLLLLLGSRRRLCNCSGLLCFRGCRLWCFGWRCLLSLLRLLLGLRCWRLVRGVGLLLALLFTILPLRGQLGSVVSRVCCWLHNGGHTFCAGGNGCSPCFRLQVGQAQAPSHFSFLALRHSSWLPPAPAPAPALAPAPGAWEGVGQNLGGRSIVRIAGLRPSHTQLPGQPCHPDRPVLTAVSPSDAVEGASTVSVAVSSGGIACGDSSVAAGTPACTAASACCATLALSLAVLLPFLAPWDAARPMAVLPQTTSTITATHRAICGRGGGSGSGNAGLVHATIAACRCDTKAAARICRAGVLAFILRESGGAARLPLGGGMVWPLTGSAPASTSRSASALASRSAQPTDLAPGCCTVICAVAPECAATGGAAGGAAGAAAGCAAGPANLA